MEAIMLQEELRILKHHRRSTIGEATAGWAVVWSG